MIGIGVDLCRGRADARGAGAHAALRDRLFTDDEQAYCDERRDPTERYAARFAAKEAVLKAMGLGIGACGWREIEVARAESGAPSIVLHGARPRLADERGDPRPGA